MWNVRSHAKMIFHHMMEEESYSEDVIDKLREKLLEAESDGELTEKKIKELFGW